VADWSPDQTQRQLAAAERRIEQLRSELAEARACDVVEEARAGIDRARARGYAEAISLWYAYGRTDAAVVGDVARRLGEISGALDRREAQLRQREARLEQIVAARVAAELRARAPWLAATAGRFAPAAAAAAREDVLGAWVADVLDGTGTRPPVSPRPRGIEIDRAPVARTPRPRRKAVVTVGAGHRATTALEID